MNSLIRNTINFFYNSFNQKLKHSKVIYEKSNIYPLKSTIIPYNYDKSYVINKELMDKNIRRFALDLKYDEIIKIINKDNHNKYIYNLKKSRLYPHFNILVYIDKDIIEIQIISIIKIKD